MCKEKRQSVRSVHCPHTHEQSTLHTAVLCILNKKKMKWKKWYACVWCKSYSRKATSDLFCVPSIITHITIIMRFWWLHRYSVEASNGAEDDKRREVEKKNKREIDDEDAPEDKRAHNIDNNNNNNKKVQPATASKAWGERIQKPFQSQLSSFLLLSSKRFRSRSRELTLHCIHLSLHVHRLPSLPLIVCEQ